MHRSAKIVLPFIFIIAGALAAWQLMAHSPKAQRESIKFQAPLVKTMKVAPENIRIPVYTQGTVKPSTTISLAAEATGRIISTAKQFSEGSFFNKDDILVQIDPEEYKLRITKSEATVAGAKQQLARAEAEHKQKIEEYKNVSPSKITDFALRKPEFEEAKARLKAAKADLKLAQLQLKRCTVRAPFDGRLTKKMADIGQYIMPGTVLATLYSTDVAEIRLPISQTQSRLINITRLNHGNGKNTSALNVVLHGHYAGQKHQWPATIIRTDANIDERNRLLYLIAQVDDPYAIQTINKSAATLTTGMFVRAEIQGKILEDIFIVPRTAVHEQSTLWLLGEGLTLHRRTVSIIHRDENNVFIDDGLKSGDTIITSPLDAVVDGMQLRIAS